MQRTPIARGLARPLPGSVRAGARAWTPALLLIASLAGVLACFNYPTGPFLAGRYSLVAGAVPRALPFGGCTLVAESGTLEVRGDVAYSLHYHQDVECTEISNVAFEANEEGQLSRDGAELTLDPAAPAGEPYAARWTGLEIAVTHPTHGDLRFTRN